MVIVIVRAMSIRGYFERELPGPSSKRLRLDSSDSSSTNGDIDESETSDSSNLLTPTTGESSDSCTKQANKFCQEWNIKREHWLKYVPGEGMFCLVCQKHKMSPFSRGTWNTTVAIIVHITYVNFLLEWYSHFKGTVHICYVHCVHGLNVTNTQLPHHITHTWFRRGGSL